MPDTPDPTVTAIFARSAAALAASGHRVTVTTSDLATPQCPWSLAWGDWYGANDGNGDSFRLLIRRHVDGDDLADLWECASPSTRLATLDQLAELVSRVAAAARKAGQDAEPAAIERIGRDVDGALGALRCPEREGGTG
jgi:hypothetical protein